MQQLLDTLVSLFILTFKLDGANGLYFDQRLKISIDQLLKFIPQPGWKLWDAVGIFEAMLYNCNFSVWLLLFTHLLLLIFSFRENLINRLVNSETVKRNVQECKNP